MCESIVMMKERNLKILMDWHFQPPWYKKSGFWNAVCAYVPEWLDGFYSYLVFNTLKTGRIIWCFSL
jgi:hypothetical protein